MNTLPADQPAREPRNKRPAPEGWSELVDFAGRQLQQHGPTPRAISSIADSLEPLSDNQLEANRYYGFGQVMCNVARGLQDPDTRAAVIDTSSSTLARKYQKSQPAAESPAPFRINDLDKDTFATGFKPLARQASGQLDPATHVVVDTLQTVSLMRRIHHLGGQYDESGNRIMPPIPESLAGIVLEGSLAADAIAFDSMSGATAALNGAFRAEHEVRKTDNPPVTADELRQLDTRALMKQFASLHRRVFAKHASNDGSRNGVDKLDDGSLRVGPEIMQEKPRPKLGLSLTDIIHTETLTCPALQVTDLIPMAAATVPDILEAAQRKVGLE